MVLAELGGRISRALQQMSNATVIDEDVLKECLNEISRALFSADVQFKMVQNMQANIKKIVNLEELAAGHNKRRIIQEVCFLTWCLARLFWKRMTTGFVQAILCDLHNYLAICTPGCIQWAVRHARPGEASLYSEEGQAQCDHVRRTPGYCFISFILCYTFQGFSSFLFLRIPFEAYCRI